MLLPDFPFLLYFPRSADHERDWPPCKVATKNLNAAKPPGQSNGLGVRCQVLSVNINGNTGCKDKNSTVDVPVYRPPVYRFALFTGVFFSCHPVTPVYRWYAGIPGWFIFSCSRSPSCCCTLPHTVLHTTHNWYSSTAVYQYHGQVEKYSSSRCCTA